MTTLSQIEFRPNEPEDVRRPKLKLLLAHLIAAEAGTSTTGQYKVSPYASGSYPVPIGVGAIIFSSTLGQPLYSDNGVRWKRFDTNAVVV